MTKAELQERLRLGEDTRTEFKSVAQRGFKADASGLAKAIVALANSGAMSRLALRANGGVKGCSCTRRRF